MLVDKSPASISDCCEAERLPYSNGIPCVPFQVRMTRLVGASAAVGPATPVVAQVEALLTPVSTQEASQLGVLAMATLPYWSMKRLLAVTRPVQSLGL